MKTSKVFLSTFGLVLLLLFIACQNVAKSPQGASVENSPFEANLQTEEKSYRVMSRDSEDNPIQILFTAEGNGEMTHLGRVKVFQQGGRNETNGTEVVRTTLVDSQGDTLFIGSRASVAIDGTFTANEQIEGGTGRYAKAKGNSSSNGQKNGKSASWKQTGIITF